MSEQQNGNEHLEFAKCTLCGEERPIVAMSQSWDDDGKMIEKLSYCEACSDATQADGQTSES